jgi:hypothetical protein
MRNVFKGYQASKMAIPKVHERAINNGYMSMHGGKVNTLKRPVLRLESTVKAAKKAPKMPGRNPGTKL